jgi:hypothetical protein
MAPHYHPGNHLHQICPYQSGTQKKNLISNTHHINPNQYFLHKESLVKNMWVLPKWHKIIIIITNRLEGVANFAFPSPSFQVCSSFEIMLKSSRDGHISRCLSRWVGCTLASSLLVNKISTLTHYIPVRETRMSLWLDLLIHSYCMNVFYKRIWAIVDVFQNYNMRPMSLACRP